MRVFMLRRCPRTLHIKLGLFIILFTSLVACGGTNAPQQQSQPASNSIDSRGVANVDKLLVREAQTEQFSGAVLIAQNGKVLLDKGYGQADEEQQIANRHDTKFRIGSLTMEFTAMSILLLQEQGKLHVQDKICTYIPSCPAEWQPLTIDQLLTHTSGLEDFTSLASYVENKTTSATPRQVIDLVKDRPLDFKPGTTLNFNYTDYNILGFIIEKVSGETYADFVQHTILDPLNLRNTGYDQNHPALPEHATGYSRAHLKTDYYDMSYPYAAAALYSTVDDLYHWDQALFKRKFASSASLDAMFAPHVQVCKEIRACDSFSELNVGYGWLIGKDSSTPARRLIVDNGYIKGFYASNTYYPDDRITVIILSNFQDIAFDIENTIQATLFPQTGS